MPSLKDFLQVINGKNKENININYSVNGIEMNTEADRKKLKMLKRALLEAMEEYVKECDEVPMAKSVEEARRTSEATSYRRLFREELEKTEEGKLPSQIIELYENSGNSIQIDKNGVCKVCLKDREIYVDDSELIHLIEKLEIYDKDDENSIYRDIKAIKQNIIKNMFLNPSDKVLDTDTLEILNSKNVPKYIIDVLTDGTFIVEFNGQRHCLPYKFSKYISSMQGLTNENQLANEINSILETYMQKFESEGNKYSLTAVKELTDWMKNEYNYITILFDGEKYYAIDKETKSVAFLNERQCEFLNKISSQTIKILYRKNRGRRTRKGLKLDSDGTYIPTGEQIRFIEYGTHKTLKELMELGYEFETKNEKKDFTDEKTDWDIIITNPFGGIETKSARREWAKLNMPYTNEMIRLVRDFNGKPNEFYDYLYDKAKHDFAESPLGKKIRKTRHNVKKIIDIANAYNNKADISMKEDDTQKKREIITIEDDGSVSIENEQDEYEFANQSNKTTKRFIGNENTIEQAKKTAENILKSARISLENAYKKRKGRKKAKRIQSENMRRQNEKIKKAREYNKYAQKMEQQDRRIEKQKHWDYLRAQKKANWTQTADEIDVVDSRDYNDAIFIDAKVNSDEFEK